VLLASFHHSLGIELRLSLTGWCVQSVPGLQDSAGALYRPAFQERVILTLAWGALCEDCEEFCPLYNELLR